jgi:hypothetical protein
MSDDELVPEPGQYGRRDNDIQIRGAFHSDIRMLDVVWQVACMFSPPVCPRCGDVRFRYLWGEHRVRCRNCGLEGSRPKEGPKRDWIEATGGFTHYDMEKKSGLEYGVSLGARRRDFQDGHIKKHGSGRSPQAGNRYIVETGFVRTIPERNNSRQTVYIALTKRLFVPAKAPILPKRRRLVRIGSTHE